MFEALSPRLAAAIGLLALVPTIIYGIGRPGMAGFVAAVNVILIFGALYVAMSPIDGSEHGSDEGATT